MSSQADDVVIEIAGSAGIQEIGSIHERVLTALQSDGNVVLDLEQADDTDITLVQLIESARRYAVTSGKVLALKQPAGPNIYSELERGGFLGRAADRMFWLQTAETRT